MVGWYAMKRGWLDHEVFAPEKPWSRAEAWVWLVEAAAYKPTVIDIGGRPYTVPRGSMCHAERFLCDKFGWGRTALRNFLKMLEAHGVARVSVAKVGTGSKHKRNQITLCNYEKYQSPQTKDEPRTNQGRTKEEQVNNITTPSIEGDAALPPSEPVEVSVSSSAVWNAGKPFLASRGVPNPGAMIGRWLKDHPPLALLGAIEAAQKSGTQDPIPYITEALKAGPQKQKEKPSGFDIASRAAARYAAMDRG